MRIDRWAKSEEKLLKILLHTHCVGGVEMETFSHILIGALCLAFLTGGGILTGLSYAAPEELIFWRLFSPVGLFLLLMVAYIVFAVMTLFDANYGIPFGLFLKVLGSLFALGIVFSLKNLIAPMFVAFTASWAVYNGVLYSDWALIPIYGFIVEVLMFWAPEWVQSGYIWGSMIYLVGASFTAFGADV